MNSNLVEWKMNFWSNLNDNKFFLVELSLSNGQFSIFETEETIRKSLNRRNSLRYFFSVFLNLIYHYCLQCPVIWQRSKNYVNVWIVNRLIGMNWTFSREKWSNRMLPWNKFADRNDVLHCLPAVDCMHSNELWKYNICKMEYRNEFFDLVCMTSRVSLRENAVKCKSHFIFITLI